MLKKIIPVIRATIVIWGGMLIPLWIGMLYIKSATVQDCTKYIDEYIRAEGAGISKQLALQFENTQKNIEKLCWQLKASDMSDEQSTKNILKKTVDENNNIASIKLYDKAGVLFASSEDKDASDLAVTKQLLKMGHDIKYNIEQLDNDDVIIRYTLLRNIGPDDADFFVEVVVKWDQYETYLKKLLTGIFPRMMYIVSPDCARYVSLNCLPAGARHNRSVAALGLHLASKINTTSAGLSNVVIDSKKFRLFKEDIQALEGLVGNKFSVMVAADSRAIDAFSSCIGRLSIVISILTAIWLVVCLVISRFYNNAKEQLRVAENITDCTPLAVAIFRVDNGQLARINLSASGLLRISNEEISKVNMWDIFVAKDDKQYMKNAAASNINVMNYEVMIQSFGGGAFWSICSLTPIQLHDQDHVILAVLDINSRKEIEKKLANNAELLEKQVADRTADLEAQAKKLEESNILLEKAKSVADSANAAKSKFLTNMSNEFKTPVNAIIGYSEILREEAIDRKDNVSADDLRKILGSAKHLLSLIDEILDLAKIEAGKTLFSFENIEIPEIIKEVEGVSMPLITENNNSLFLEFPKDIGIMYTDATKLRQCLLNLLSNAAKFTDFGKVTLRASQIVQAGIDFIEFSVIDTGSGIPADKLQYIFDSFQDNSSSHSGTGLGLSITKKYVEYMGGTITVDSEEGVGSKFTIRVPRICTTTSNEFIEVAGRPTEEAIEDIVVEAEQAISLEEAAEAKTFARKSDNV